MFHAAILAVAEAAAISEPAIKPDVTDEAETVDAPVQGALKKRRGRPARETTEQMKNIDDAPAASSIMVIICLHVCASCFIRDSLQQL